MIMRVGQNDDRIKRDAVEDDKNRRMSAAVEAMETMPPGAGQGQVPETPQPAPVVDNAPAELERLKQYRVDHDKLHEEIAERAGDVEEERARAHGEMMQALHELMQMLGTLLAAQGHVVASDDKGSHDYGPRPMEFQIRRGQNGLIDRVIATPKLDG